MIAWTCVVDDGTRPWGPAIPTEQRRPLHMIVGESADIEVTLINPVGGVVVIDELDFLQLNIRTLCAPTRQLLTRRSNPTTRHRHVIDFPTSITAAIPPTRGGFDLWLVRGVQRVTLIPMSEFSIAFGGLGNNYL